MKSASSNALRIGLLGAGRVASQLAPALVTAGHQVPFVWSRHAENAAKLAAHLPGASVLTSLARPLPPADLYLLALPDAAVAPLLTSSPWPEDALVVHVAGALPLPVVASR